MFFETDALPISVRRRPASEQRSQKLSDLLLSDLFTEGVAEGDVRAAAIKLGGAEHRGGSAGGRGETVLWGAGSDSSRPVAVLSSSSRALRAGAFAG